MRLNPILVQDIVRAIASHLLDNDHVAGDPQGVFDVILAVIDEDARIEEEIEEEAKALMRQHRQAIRSSEADIKLLFQKLKRELAEQKGRVL